MKTLTTLEDCVEDDRNANDGTLRGSQLLDRSLETFGAHRGITTDCEGRVIAGNKTLDHALEMGLPIRVVPSDGTKLIVVQRIDLDATEPGMRRLNYLDNRCAETGLSWNATRLADDLAVGVPVDALFRPEELTKALEPLTDGGGGRTALIFTTAAEFAVWEAFLAHLKQAYPSVAEADRCDAWVVEQLATAVTAGGI